MEEENNVKFSWSVQRFDTLPIVPGTSLLSPKFYAHSSQAAEFCLRIEAGPFPSTSCVGSLSLCRCDNRGPEHVEVEYKMIFPPRSESSTYRQKFLKPEHGSLYQSYETDALKITKDDMTEDQFHVTCAILSYTDQYETSEVGDYEELHDLVKTFSNMFNTHFKPDLIIRVQNDKFGVHRAVLHARCPGLLEVFEVKDYLTVFLKYDKSIIRNLLNYIYSGEFQGEDIPDDLYFILKKCNYSLFNRLCLPFFKVLHAHTSFKSNEFFFDWTIENFFKFKDTMEFSRIIMDNDPSTWFKMTFYVIQHNSTIRHLKFAMHKMCEKTAVFVRYRLRIVDAAGESAILFHGSHLFNDVHPIQVTLDDKIGIIRIKLYWDSAMFDVKIELTDGVPVNSMRSIKESSQIPRSQNIIRLHEFGHDLGKLYNNSVHSDIILKINDSRIPAHKAILCARSPVLCRRIEQISFKVKHPEISVNDLDKKVALSMIHYIYSADVINFDTDLAFELYNAANLYEIPQLKKKCFIHLKSSLNATNAGQILLFADAQKNDELKSFVFEFINSYPRGVLESKEFKGIMKSFEYLHLEAIKEIKNYIALNL